jgi:hypothetical protein
MFPAHSLAADVTALNTAYPGLKRLIKVTAGLATYIANNAAAVVNYRRRWDNGERISTAFAESTVNLVISRRFAKKQQMQCSKEGPIGSCRPEPRLSTAHCAICSPGGIRA